MWENLQTHGNSKANTFLFLSFFFLSREVLTQSEKTKSHRIHSDSRQKAPTVIVSNDSFFLCQKQRLTTTTTRRRKRKARIYKRKGIKLPGEKGIILQEEKFLNHGSSAAIFPPKMDQQRFCDPLKLSHSSLAFFHLPTPPIPPIPLGLGAGRGSVGQPRRDLTCQSILSVSYFFVLFPLSFLLLASHTFLRSYIYIFSISSYSQPICFVSFLLVIIIIIYFRLVSHLT